MAESKEFKKESGTGGINGQELEYKCLALLYLRSLNPKNDITKFRLAANFKALENHPGRDFQDIGLEIIKRPQSYLQDEACAPRQDEPEVFYVQLKYKESKSMTWTSLTLDGHLNLNDAESNKDPEEAEDTEDVKEEERSKGPKKGKGAKEAKPSKAPFYLGNYYEWYKKLAGEKKMIFHPSRLEHIVFVLYTTAALKGKKLQKMEEDEQIRWHKDNFLNTSSKKTPDINKHYFTFNADNCDELLRTFGGNDKKSWKQNFIRKLRIYPEQSKISRLDCIIQEELGMVYQSSDVEVYYPFFIDRICRWWKRNRKAPFLTEQDKLLYWQNACGPIVQRTLISETKSMLQEIGNYGVEFKEDITVTSSISDSVILFVCSSGGTTRMSLMYLIQILENGGADKEFLITNLSFLEQERDTILYAWNNCGKSILIVLCENHAEDSYDFLLPIVDEVRNNHIERGESRGIPKKIIFLDLPISGIDKIIDHHDGVVPTELIELQVTLSSLHEESQNKILDRTINVCQGDSDTTIPTKLRDLKGPDLGKIKDRLNADVLWLLIQNIALEFFSLDSSANPDLDNLFTCEANDPNKNIMPVLVGAGRIAQVMVSRFRLEYNQLNKFMNGSYTTVTEEDCRELSRSVPRIAATNVRRVLGENELTSAVTELLEDTMNLDMWSFIGKYVFKILSEPKK